MKRKRKRGQLALIGLSLATVFVLSSLAFLLWLFWPDLKQLMQPAATHAPRRSDPKPAPEQISEGERKELEKLLKRK